MRNDEIQRELDRMFLARLTYDYDRIQRMSVISTCATITCIFGFIALGLFYVAGIF